jgi:hypothetical protein
MVSIMEPLGVLLLSAIWLLPSVSAFYLPGVAPQDFAKVQFDFHAFCCNFCAFFGFPCYFFVLFPLSFCLCSVVLSWIDGAVMLKVSAGT